MENHVSTRSGSNDASVRNRIVHSAFIDIETFDVDNAVAFMRREPCSRQFTDGKLTAHG